MDALKHLLFIAMLIIGGILGCVFHKRILEEVAGRSKIVVFVCMVAFGFIWGLLHAHLFYFALSDIKGNTQVDEGVVHVAGKQPFHGHAVGDKITVGGQPFVVDYFASTLGYQKTIAHGGALNEGVYVRLHHCNGMILKVEVRTKKAGQ